ncbi:hypothetical protein PM082_000248 [Marasmius tenuissimus]|nr:hypothetical protein PM082_000248 [Marasmius tenuissimus]
MNLSPKHRGALWVHVGPKYTSAFSILQVRIPDFVVQPTLGQIRMNNGPQGHILIRGPDKTMYIEMTPKAAITEKKALDMIVMQSKVSVPVSQWQVDGKLNCVC